MKKEDFYRKYANLPLEKRMILIPDGSETFPKGLTLNQVYQQISYIDDKIRNDEIERERLLRVAANSKLLI